MHPLFQGIVSLHFPALAGATDRVREAMQATDNAPEQGTTHEGHDNE